MASNMEAGEGVDMAGDQVSQQTGKDGNMSKPPLYVYLTVGDYQWEISGFPMESAASVDELFEWMAKTYDVKRVYWRGEQDRIWLRNFVCRRENPLYDNIWGWLGYLNETVRTNERSFTEPGMK